MLYPFRLSYDLERRALVRRGCASPLPGQFEPKRVTCITGIPQLSIDAFAELIRVELEHDFSSGHVWFTETERVIAELPPSEVAGLERVLAAADLEEVVSLYRDPGAFDPGSEAVLGLFESRHDADFIELSRSASFDGKAPYLKLRLGRPRLEIALDENTLHAWSIAAPGDLEGEPARVIEQRFGPALLAAAVHFYSS